MPRIHDTILVNGKEKRVSCACATLNRAGHHPACPYYKPVRVEERPIQQVAIPTKAETQTTKEEPQMARRAAAKVETAEPAAVNEVRAWLLEQSELPEGVSVAQRGRLSAQAKEYFTSSTGRPVAVPESA